MVQMHHVALFAVFMVQVSCPMTPIPCVAFQSKSRSHTVHNRYFGALPLRSYFNSETVLVKRFCRHLCEHHFKERAGVYAIRAFIISE